MSRLIVAVLTAGLLGAAAIASTASAATFNPTGDPNHTVCVINQNESGTQQGWCVTVTEPRLPTLP